MPDDEPDGVVVPGAVDTGRLVAVVGVVESCASVTSTQQNPGPATVDQVAGSESRHW